MGTDNLSFCENSKKFFFFFFWGGGGGGGSGREGGIGLGDQGGCERRSKVFVRIQKKKIEGGRGQGRVGWGSGGIRGWGRGGWVARFGVGG